MQKGEATIVLLSMWLTYSNDSWAVAGSADLAPAAIEQKYNLVQKRQNLQSVLWHILY